MTFWYILETHTHVHRHKQFKKALADYAKLINAIKKEWNSVDSPVIGFGGSYGGMLCAFFRMKYAHLMDGCIAGSYIINIPLFVFCFYFIIVIFFCVFFFVQCFVFFLAFCRFFCFVLFFFKKNMQKKHTKKTKKTQQKQTLKHRKCPSIRISRNVG